MLCYFQVHSKVNQLYIYIYPLCFRFFFHLFPQPPIVFIKGNHGIEAAVSAFLPWARGSSWHILGSFSLFHWLLHPLLFLTYWFSRTSLKRITTNFLPSKNFALNLLGLLTPYSLSLSPSPLIHIMQWFLLSSWFMMSPVL